MRSAVAATGATIAEAEGSGPDIVEIERKGKTPILKAFLYALLAIIPLVALTDFISADYDVFFGELIVIGTVGGSLALLRNGFYRAASRISSALLYFGSVYIALTHPFTDTGGVFRLVAYSSAALGFASFFLIENRLPLAIAATNGLVAIIFLIVGFSVKKPRVALGA